MIKKDSPEKYIVALQISRALTLKFAYSARTCTARHKRAVFFQSYIKGSTELYFGRSNNFHIGVKSDRVQGADPLLVHYREENERLQNANEELAEKVRDLGESLAEQDCREDPCEKVKYVREKIAALRDRFAAEKKRYAMPIDHMNSANIVQ